MIKFESLEKFYIKDKGQVFVVLNNEECEDFNHIIEKIIEIDGNEYKAKAVEMFMHSPPWIKGEKIGILVY